MHDPRLPPILGTSRTFGADPASSGPDEHAPRAALLSCVAATQGFVFAPEFARTERESLPSAPRPSAAPPRAGDVRRSCESLGTLP